MYGSMYTRCVICGEFVDYCAGHGDAGTAAWDRHDIGDHRICHPDACWV
jgi:hypothetical protein